MAVSSPKKRIAAAIDAVLHKPAAAEVVSKRYLGAEDDSVIGLIQERNAESYKLEIPGACVSGLLPVLAFDGASQRNRPMLNPGDCLHCRVERCRPGLEIELTCKEKHKEDAKGWMTKEARYGALPPGATARLIICSTHFAKVLLSDENAMPPLLEALREQFPNHKLIVGANGLCWIKAETTLGTTIIANAIENAAILPASQHASMLDTLIAKVQAQSTIATALLQSDSASAQDGAGIIRPLALASDHAQHSLEKEDKEDEIMMHE